MVKKKGTDAADLLKGSSAADDLLGIGGSDTIRGFAKGDTIAGGDGSDGRVDVIVEFHDMVLHGDEFEVAVFRNGDANRLAGIFNNLLGHNRPLSPACPAGYSKTIR